MCLCCPPPGPTFSSPINIVPTPYTILLPFSPLLSCPMPLPLDLLPCSSSSAAEDHTSGDQTAYPPPPQPPTPLTLHLSSSTASDSSSSSDSTAAISSSADDSASLLTLSSLQSLVPSLLDPLPFSASFQCLSSLHTPAGAPAAVAVSAAASSSLLLYLACAAEISVYDLASLRHLESFPAAPAAGSVKSVAFSPDGRAFTAHQDGRIRAWKSSPRSGRHRLISSLPTAADRLRRLPLPSNYITIRRHKKLLWIQHADAVSAVAAGGGLLYSVSWDKTLKIWRASDLRCIESVAAHDDAVNAVAVASDGTVFTGSADRRIRVWGPSAGQKGRHGLVATLEKHRSAVNALAVSDDGTVLYSGACDRSILVWEKEDSANFMAVAGALRGHQKAILCLACVGDLVCSGSSDRTVRIWRRGGEGKGYSCLGVLEGHLSGVRSVAAVRVPPEAAAAEGKGEREEEYRVCCGSLDGEVKVWQVRFGAASERWRQKKPL